MSKRSIKVGGATTSLFLEEAFWREIQLRADEEGVSNAAYLRMLLNQFDHQDNRSSTIKEFLITELRGEYRALQRKKGGTLRSKWLVEIDGIRSRREFKQSVITIGSSSCCDITLNGENISAKQMLLTHDGNNWWLVNLYPSLPIFLNSKKIEVTTLLKSGEIGIDKYQIIKG